MTVMQLVGAIAHLNSECRLCAEFRESTQSLWNIPTVTQKSINLIQLRRQLRRKMDFLQSLPPRTVGNLERDELSEITDNARESRESNGPREVSDLSPQSDPKRTWLQPPLT